MNSSSNINNASSLQYYRDSYTTAVVKNVFVVALGISINYINGTLLHTFRKHQIFHLNPRYILYIHLVVNDMIQLSVTVSLFVISYTFHKIHASLCTLLIIFAILTTFNTPLNLAVMAVECYVAICFPLRHTQLCTIRTTYVLIGWIWAMSTVSMLTDVFLMLATNPAHLFLPRIYCIRDNLFPHPAILQKRDVSYILCLVGVWLTLLYTYFKIFFTAKTVQSMSGKSNKARNTILLHGFQLLLCMLTYVDDMIKTAVMSFFPKHAVQALFVCYIVIQVLPRFISPIVYGLRDKTFKQYLKKYVLCTSRPNKS